MKLNKRFKFLTMVVLTLSILFANTINTFAYNKYNINESKSTTCTTVYTLKNLQHNNVIQNFFITGDSVYITQKFHGDTNTAISKCKIDEATKTATYESEMVLPGFGHGETLDMYTFEDQTYFLVTYAPSNGTPTLARIQYATGEHSISEYPQIVGMNYANKAAKSLGTPSRVIGVFSSANKFIFRVQTTSGSVSYSYYDGNTINNLLNNGNVNLKDNKNACLSSFTQTGDDIVRPYGNMQGMEVRQRGDIYVCGNSKINEPGKPRIAKMNTSGACTIEMTIRNCKDSDEIEGLKIKGQTIYFAIHNRENGDKINGQRICSISLY